VLLALSGCATSNSAWLSEPEAGMSLGSDLAVPLAHGDRPTPYATLGVREPVASGGSAPAGSRRRLDRTVTLSGVITSAEVEATAGAPPATPRVQVTVNNYAAPPAYGGFYDDSYYGPLFFRDGIADDRPERSRPKAPTVGPGQDFPAPPSYGPPFPFKTAPASPWK
jgi:hypothetical protein